MDRVARDDPRTDARRSVKDGLQQEVEALAGYTGGAE